MIIDDSVYEPNVCVTWPVGCDKLPRTVDNNIHDSDTKSCMCIVESLVYIFMLLFMDRIEKPGAVQCIKKKKV